MGTAPTTAASTPTGATAASAGLLLLQPAVAVDSAPPLAGFRASDNCTLPAPTREVAQIHAVVAPPGLPSPLLSMHMPAQAHTALMVAPAEEAAEAAEAEVAAEVEEYAADTEVCVWREDIVPAGLRERHLFAPSFADELNLVATGRPDTASTVAVLPCVADEAESEEGLSSPLSVRLAYHWPATTAGQLQ
jgi:hypothetical protein